MAAVSGVIGQLGRRLRGHGDPQLPQGHLSRRLTVQRQGQLSRLTYGLSLLLPALLRLRDGQSAHIHAHHVGAAEDGAVAGGDDAQNQIEYAQHRHDAAADEGRQLPGGFFGRGLRRCVHLLRDGVRLHVRCRGTLRLRDGSRGGLLWGGLRRFLLQGLLCFHTAPPLLYSAAHTALSCSILRKGAK